VADLAGEDGVPGAELTGCVLEAELAGRVRSIRMRCSAPGWVTQHAETCHPTAAAGLDTQRQSPYRCGTGKRRTDVRTQADQRDRREWPTVTERRVWHLERPQLAASARLGRKAGIHWFCGLSSDSRMKYSGGPGFPPAPGGVLTTTAPAMYLG
jgi:hypothetical protein